MSWRKVSDDLHSHPKMARLSLAARGLWVTCLSWTGQHQTDGEVSEFIVKQHAGALTKKLTTELVSAGLWDVVDGGGWSFRNYLEYQPSSYEEREAAAKKSAARSDAGRKGAVGRWQTDGKPASKPDGKAIAPNPNPNHTVPTEQTARTNTPIDPESNASLSVEKKRLLEQFPWWEKALDDATPVEVRARIRYQSKIWRNWQENPEKAPAPPRAPTEEQIRTEVTKEVFHTVPKNPDESYEQYMERTSSIMAKRCRERANEAMAKYPDYIDVSGSMNRQRVAA